MLDSEFISLFDTGRQTLESKQIPACDLVFQWLIKVSSTVEGSLVSSFTLRYEFKT